MYLLKQSQYNATFPAFHQEKADGYLNMTSVFNQPILLSQNHLYGIDDRIASKFAYFGNDNSQITPNQELDGGFFEAEQKTGTVTRMRLNLHFNLEIKNTLLFVGAESHLEQLQPMSDLPFLVPLYNLVFFADVPKSEWSSLFGYITSANWFLSHFWLIFLPLFLVSLVIFVILLLLYLRKAKQQVKHGRDVNSQNKLRLI